MVGSIRELLLKVLHSRVGALLLCQILVLAGKLGQVALGIKFFALKHFLVHLPIRLCAFGVYILHQGRLFRINFNIRRHSVLWSSFDLTGSSLWVLSCIGTLLKVARALHGLKVS